MKMPPLPVVLENFSHVLAEFDCLDPLLSALRLDSGRLKVGDLTAPYPEEKHQLSTLTKWFLSICPVFLVCCGAVYLLSSVEEVAGIGDISRRVAPHSEGGLEAKAHPHP